MVKFNFVIDAKELKIKTREKLIDIGHEIFADSQENIIKNGTSDEGTLLKSGNVVIGDDYVEIKYSVPYAEVIEFGRAPNTFPPIAPLQGWVRRKLGIRNEQEAKQVAFRIANKIKKQGTDPQPFLRPAIEKAKQKYKR